jgi:hypothetical protein
MNECGEGLQKVCLLARFLGLSEHFIYSWPFRTPWNPLNMINDLIRRLIEVNATIYTESEDTAFGSLTLH